MSENVLYAAYGPNSDLTMLHAITGERAIMLGKVAILDVELAVHKMDTALRVPVVSGMPTPHDILEQQWGKEGESYVVQENKGSEVEGYLFRLSPLADELRQDWELITLGWKYDKEVRVRFESDGSVTRALTEFLCPGQPVDRVVPGSGYPLYLNSAIKMHLAAAKARRDYLKAR